MQNQVTCKKGINIIKHKTIEQISGQFSVHQVINKPTLYWSLLHALIKYSLRSQI